MSRSSDENEYTSAEDRVTIGGTEGEEYSIGSEGGERDLTEIEVRRVQYEEMKTPKLALQRKRKREESKAYLRAESRLPGRGPRLLKDLLRKENILVEARSHSSRDEAELVIAK